MYIPGHFAVTDPEILWAFIESYSFGLLVSQVNEEPFATHLPFLLERSRSDKGALVGHIARTNPHWKDRTDQPALVVFSGPHSYISPTWYESDHVVPTWNYAAVHVYGRIQWIHEPEELLAIVRDSVQFYESGFPQPWQLPEERVFLDRLLNQIVGFRLTIERVEGKFKMSQNHPVERREKVIKALIGQGSDESLAVAKMMESEMPGKNL